MKQKAVTLESRGSALTEERAQAESALTEALATARAAAAALSSESGRRSGLEARAHQLSQGLENHERNVDLSTEESVRAIAEGSLAKERILAAKELRAEAEARVAAARVEEAAAATPTNYCSTYNYLFVQRSLKRFPCVETLNV